VESVRRSGISDLEIVVVDDGSTDDTADVARTLGPDVRYFYQLNAGPGAARNRGARACRGRYLAFLDSDDRWLPDGLHQLVELMEAHPEVAVGFGDALAGDQRNGYRSRAGRRGLAALLQFPGRELVSDFRVLERRAFFKAMAESNPLFIGAAILRRDVFEHVGGFDEDLKFGEDWELWVRLAAGGYAFAYYDRPLAVWEEHAGNLSANIDEMERGILALEKILARPLALPADYLETVRAHRVRLMDAWAYMAFDRGDVASARERFAAAMRNGGVRPWRLFYWCCCWLGPRAVRRLRALKWRIAEVRARGWGHTLPRRRR
jgi:glycosyltransferase involved in cell wall biosynthesis